MSSAMLIDTTKCIGCRSCQVSCKEWNNLPAENTSAPEKGLGLQNPKVLSAKTLVVVTDHEVDDPKAPGGVRTVFAKRQCMHCDEPACVSACPVTAMHKTAEGPVVYDKSRCIGCRYCMWACPWGVPTAQWDSLAPKISKCTMCYDRLSQSLPVARNGQSIQTDKKAPYATKLSEPLCIKQCPAGALKHGSRDQLLAEAKQRIKNNPGMYVDHIYGEHEAGGTGVLYLASVPFEQIGFPKVQTEPLPHISAIALGSVPPAVIGVGAVLGGVAALNKRRAKVAAEEAGAKKETTHHVEFAPVGNGNPFSRSNLFSRGNMLLLFMMAFGALSFLVRFAIGLGGSTNLSDTWAWGLWIVFDFVWIAIAAGAFATAGLIYVFAREDLYSIGRSAVLMGLLSYTFVVLTLMADLGLPWHFYALGMYAPKHSAMFEVSWCIFFYLTVLAFEFLPVPLDFFKLGQWKAVWTKYSPIYVVFAVSLFVYLMSRNLLYTAATFAVFGFMAYAFRTKEGQKPVPVMLAIAAVTLSTMHQSSLGSLFLLMPDKLNHLWWSPVMPICYFLSSIAAGTALMVLVEMWIAKAFKRAIPMKPLASMGQVAFWTLLVYLVARLADVAIRGQLAQLFTSPHSVLFLIEIVVLGFVPLAMLGTPSLRNRPATLGCAALLSVSGIVWNRAMGVIFAMNLTGPMPQIAPTHYFPSIWEWGISVGMIATTIFLFGMGVRLVPILPKEEQATFTD